MLPTFTDFKVLLLGGDVSDGCGFYRVHEPARVTRDLGVNVETDDGLDSVAYLNADHSVKIEKIDHKDADIVVFQRPTTSSLFETIKFLQNKGVACVVETDDDLTALHRNNMAYDNLNPANSRGENWEWYRRCCEIADLVIGSTPALVRRHAKHGRGLVLRNLLPESFFDDPLERTGADLRVGWSGTVQNHPEDLQQAGSHLNVALAGRDFYVVGDGQGVKEALNLSGDVVATGWVPRGEYINTLARSMDIGVVPLKIDAFNQAKSYLKGMEMCSQGIPCVVSPTEEYTLFSQMTGTPVADRGKQWQKHVKKLLGSVDYYLGESDRVREAVRNMTYENHAEDWAQAWSLALQNRRDRSR